jgi:hypothetical protein
MVLKWKVIRVGVFQIIVPVPGRRRSQLGGHGSESASVRSSTRRLLERAAEDNVDRRPPTETPAARVTPGSVLIREWHGVSHRVTVLAEGVLLRGARYRSLSEVARKITGTRDRRGVVSKSRSSANGPLRELPGRAQRR